MRDQLTQRHDAASATQSARPAWCGARTSYYIMAPDNVARVYALLGRVARSMCNVDIVVATTRSSVSGVFMLDFLLVVIDSAIFGRPQ